jgi:hypothetical protein
MAKRAVDVNIDPFTPITSEADWDAKGWAREPEPLTAAPRLAARISIDLDPESASLVRRAARRMGVTRAEFVRRAALREAIEALGEDEE